MENNQVEPLEMQPEVLPRKMWSTPQLESVEFLDTSFSPNPGVATDFGIYANRSS